MARAVKGGMFMSAGNGRIAFNLHNLNLVRAGSGGATSVGFQVEMLSENARIALDDSLARGVVLIAESSVEALVISTDETKQKMRSYLDAHFTGSEMHGNNHRRVSNAAVQSVYYDDVVEKGQIAALIYSKFGAGQGASFVDFLLLHMRGGTIRPKAKDWIKIPNLQEPGARSAQAGHFGMSDSDIFFVRAKDDPGKLFQLRRYNGKGKTVLLGTLLKSLRFEPSLAGLDAILAARGAEFERNFGAVFSRKRSEAGLG